METTSGRRPPPRELLIIGGNLALDFANTIDDPHGPARHDHAATWPDLLAWSTQVGTVTTAQAARLRQATDRKAQSELIASAHQLRKAISGLFGGGAGESPPLAEYWVKLRPFVADSLAHATLEPGGDPPTLAWRVTDAPHGLLHPIAAAAADLLRSRDLHRIKQCAQCPWLFVDRSRNHSRRWCSMDDCGTAVKMRAYVTRRAAMKGNAD